MKEIKVKDKIYLEEYDIYVNPYLTYSQIQKIVEATQQQTVWAFRQQNIDMLVLLYATNIGKENLEKNTHDVLLSSGLIEAVFNSIINIKTLYEAINYTESIQQAFIKIATNLSHNLGEKKNGSKTNKKSDGATIIHSA